jgi:hypothetical protein
MGFVVERDEGQLAKFDRLWDYRLMPNGAQRKTQRRITAIQ